jgi:hypothetical protein
MERQQFMLVVGWFHVIFGAFFLLFSELAITLFIDQAGPSSALIVRGLAGICFAFGLMNLIARKSKPGPALKAVLVGTLFYLLFTVSCDIHWTSIGLLKPLAWFSIVIRIGFAGGYVYLLFRSPGMYICCSVPRKRARHETLRPK